MSPSQRARKAHPAVIRGRSSAIVTVASLIAGVSLGGLAFASGWYLSHSVNFAATSVPSMGGANADADIATSSVTTSSATTSSVSQSPSSNKRVAMAAFTDRFQPAVDAPLGRPEPVVLGGQVAWLDPVYSFGPPPETFAAASKVADSKIIDAKVTETKVAVANPAPPQAKPVQQASVTPKPAVKPQELALLSPPPAPREVAAAIATPASRPAETRGPRARGATSHDALVKKARAVLLASAKAGRPSWFSKLFNNEPQPEAPVLAYASADADADVTTGSVSPVSAEASAIDRQTAVYDIVAATVYMPDGSKLEAHSGLGSRMDKPEYAHVRMHGVTPPHIYDLTPREALFHGVAALRMTPIGGAEAIHNRTGILAHTYMLGPNGDSNGCVSIKDYDRFIKAYDNGEFNRLVVVPSLGGSATASQRTSTDS